MSPEYGATCGFFPVDDETLALPAPHRPRRRAGRARRGVLQGEHALARPRRARHVLAGRRARPRDGRAVARRAAPPAGPGRAREREDARSSRRSRASASTTATASMRPSRSRSPRATRPRTPSPGATAPTGGQGVSPAPVAIAPTWTTGVPCELDGQIVHLDARRRRDRRDHLLHEHVEPVRDGRPRACSRRRRSSAGSTGKPWVKSSLAPGSKVVTRLLRAGRADAVPRGARLPHGRLRLHDLHRELRPAARARLAGDRRGRPRRVRRPLREPELRGARPPGGEGELPRDPAARRRLRARRPDGRRPRHRAARPRRERQARLPRATSGRRPRRCA